MDLTQAMRLFEKITQRAEAHQEYLHNSEFRTRILLIDPVLRLLGWDVENPELVVLEYQPAESSRESVDYVLRNSGKNVAIVEAKNIDTKIDDLKHRQQADDYARYAGVKFFILTNGVTWMLYERDLMTSLESLEPGVRFDVVDDEPYRCALAAISMWRPSLASDSGPSEATESVFIPQRQQLPDDTENDEDIVTPKETRQPASQITRWSGDKRVREVVWEAVQELTRGDTNVEFVFKGVSTLILKKYPDFNKNTVRAQLASGSPNRPSYDGKHKYYWWVRRGTYRLYDPERDR